MPRLDDDGQTVTLDLHGARVDEALDLAERTLEEAIRRGRREVRLVHGYSTDDGHRRTIKRSLHDALDRGELSGTTSALRGAGQLTLGLDLSAPSDPRRLTLLDVA